MSLDDQIKKVMFDAGAEAREILLKNFGKLKTVEKKGANDLVTNADKESEDAILSRIRKAFPGHAILAEESGESGAPQDAEFWVVDPLDGTTNYAHGAPIFSTSIGLLREGKPYMGLIVDPTRDEWFHARRGAGATLNGQPIRVTTENVLLESVLVMGFPYAVRGNERHFTDIIEAVLSRVRNIARLGSAAIDLSWVAAGRYEAFWEETLSPWDVAAGMLIVEEAGGRVTPFNGEPATPFDGQIVASNDLIHEDLLEAIRGAWRAF